MPRSLLLLPGALLLAACTVDSPLPCALDSVAISGNVADEAGDPLAPQAASVQLGHAPGGCLISASVTVVGPGGTDCELRALADEPRPEGGLWVTSLRVESTGDCGWPATVNGSSSGGAGSWIELDGEVDVTSTRADRACATGSLRLEVNSTLEGNSSETITGTYTLGSGLVSIEDRAATCPDAGDDDDATADDDDSAGDDDDSAR